VSGSHASAPSQTRYLNVPPMLSSASKTDVNSRNGKELVGDRKLLERHNARGPGANAGDFHDAAVTS